MNQKFKTEKSASSPWWVRAIRATIVAVVMFFMGASLGFCGEGETSGQQSKIPNQNNVSVKNKPIMIMFTGSDWCDYCKKMDAEIVNTPEFKNWSKRFVVMKVDFPKYSQLSPQLAARNFQLKNRYRDLVTSYPTVLFLNEQGSVVGKMSYVQGGAKAWITQAGQIAPSVAK